MTPQYDDGSGLATGEIVMIFGIQKCCFYAKHCGRWDLLPLLACGRQLTGSQLLFFSRHFPWTVSEAWTVCICSFVVESIAFFWKSSCRRGWKSFVLCSREFVSLWVPHISVGPTLSYYHCFLPSCYSVWSTVARVWNQTQKQLFFSDFTAHRVRPYKKSFPVLRSQ